MDLGLAGQVAIVTGASKGIGLAVTEALVDEGVTVVAGARRATPELMRLARTGTSTSSPPTSVHRRRGGPPRRRGGRPRAARHPRQQRRRRDPTARRLPGGDRRAVARRVHAQPHGRRAHHARRPADDARGRPRLDRHGSSVNAFLADPLVIDYGAAKAALTNFCKALSKEFGGQGHPRQHRQPRPGRHGPLAGTRRGRRHPRRGERYRPLSGRGRCGRCQRDRTLHPTRRGGRLVAFLASDVAGNVTGADVTIDGGLITTT